MNKAFHVSEGILQFFIGIGAAASGIILMIKPDGSLMSMPLSMLEHSPFETFFIPGLILFLINGIGNVFSGILSFKKHRLAGFAGIFFGFGLMIWIFVQVIMVQGIHWLHMLYFILGILEIVLGIGIREVVNN